MTTETPDRRLARAAGLEVFAEGADLILAGPAGMLKLDGGVASAVRERLLPALRDRPDRAGLLTALDDLPPAEVSRLLDRLIDAGMITESGPSPVPGWLDLLSTDAGTREAFARRLDGVRVLVIGADADVVALAGQLTAAGIGAVDGVAPPEASQDALPGLVAGRDLVICAVEAGWTAVRSWVNRACLDAGTPALFVALEGSFGYLGPLLLPGEGPCYLCWRMRALACSDDFQVAMAREESLDSSRTELGRPLLPGLREAAWAIVVRETLALATSALRTELPGTVLVLDQLRGRTERHPVLPRPDCPACRKKARPPAGPAESAEPGRRRTDFDRIASRAVSQVCGLIRYLDVVPKPITEPRQPLIVRAQLANVLFGQGEDAFVTCSGKGMTATGARDGAIGEALERYASLTWTPQRSSWCPRGELPGESLDPRELVLFTDADAERLGHARYHDQLPLDWAPARSLVSGAEVWVPFQAVTLHGSRWPRHQLLFAPTSNGFAAGPTVEFAAEQAILEVIERDAFCIAWAHRLVTQPYAATTLPDPDAAAIAELYRRRGVRIDIHLLPTDGTAAVAMAVGWSEDEPAAVVGLGASQDPLTAARSAVLEVGQVRPALRARLQDPAVREHRARLAADPSLVTELDDHDLLYSDPAVAAERMAHLRALPARDWAAPPVRGQGLDDLVASLAPVAGDVLIVDVTPADVADLGVRVVRGIVPGFQPIHFGADQARLGHPRLFTAPQRWGLRARPARADELNPDPHPLA
ncbi:MAG: TOMM precursor leader peptide-binding protein [Micropruina sp.]|uniref:TOMM precursor leader peptide-binding protein n=1 Tax=Micropruina sp. TaxID=2737536 RepID=UPI0039E31C28